VQYDATDTSHSLPHAHPALQSDSELSMPEKEGAHSFDQKKLRNIPPLFYHTRRETGDRNNNNNV
jgi:hypothetical protein